MFDRSHFRRLLVAALCIGFVAFAPGRVRVAAQTRQISVETLIYDLNSPDAIRRQEAARGLAVARYLPAIPKLLPLTSDPDPAVRRAVELTLEAMEDIRTLPGFVAFAGDSEDDVRSRAVSSLVRIHLPRNTGVMAALTKLGELIALAPDRDLELIVEPDVPIDPTVVTTLRARVDDAESRIRRTAIRGLGILRAKPGVPELLRVVREDRDAGLRFEAVRSLRKIGDASIADQLVPLLNINSDAVRIELMATLASMHHRGAVAELTRIVNDTKEGDSPRISALAALADIADPASIAVFQQFKVDRNELLRLYANEGLARTSDTGMKTAISAARLTEKSARVRTAQAFALLRIGEGEYLDELIRALERPATRDFAKEYLVETQPSDRAALFAPRSASPAVRAELADVLGLIGDRGALPRLQEMARDPDADVARAAERATRRLAVMSSDQ